MAPHTLSSKSKKFIVMASDAKRYYAQIRRDITPSNMEWSTMANFDVQWQALKDLKKQDDPDVPKLTKSGSIIKWIESFKLHLNEIVGVRNCPLVYVVREQADLTNVTRGNLMAGQRHSEENGSLEAELVQLTSHDHPLFRNNNGDLYNRMERALSGSN